MVFTAFPLLALSVAIYNLFAIFASFGPTGADDALRAAMFYIPMASGARWGVGFGDTLEIFSLILLFVELVKATSSRSTAIINHALSMLLFIFALVEFLLFKPFATSTFFVLLFMILLDVLAGFIVTIVASRRQLDFRNDSGAAL